MSVSWPDSFPNPTLQDYSVSPDESIARTQMDSGVARQRRRFTSVPSKVSVRWIMDSSTFGIFEAWYKHKAKEGAEWIKINLMNGLGFLENEARFLKPYNSKILSDSLWEVTANLEVREMSAISEGVLDIILNLKITNIETLVNILHKYIHEEKSTIYKW